MIQFSEYVRFPIRPMVGVIGVAPADAPIATLHAGEHGGNMDDRYHGEGTTVYFPVRQLGALFAVGDMHAAMGDGEICGTGVEVAGEVTIRFNLLKGRSARFPVSETSTHWMCHGVSEHYPEALLVACEDAATLLTTEWGLSAEDAFMLLGLCGDAGVCQSCQPCVVASIARLRVPKLDGIPRPFA